MFITIDRWRSAEHFTRFDAQFDTQYRTLDTHLQQLTLQERKLEAFSSRMWVAGPLTRAAGSEVDNAG